MDRHLFEAFISLTETLADKLARRLELRPPVKAVDRSLVTVPVDAPPMGLEAPASLPEYLTTQEVAALLGLSVKGLEGMRGKGTGPAFVKIGGRIRYPRSGLKKSS
jgi:hypothetical protein